MHTFMGYFACLVNISEIFIKFSKRIFNTLIFIFLIFTSKHEIGHTAFF